MSQVVKEEQQKLEQLIHDSARDPGVQHIRTWLFESRDLLNRSWPRMDGDKLTRAQGYAGTLNDLIRIIDEGPKLRLPSPTLNAPGGQQ